MCGRVTLEFDLQTLKEILTSAYHVGQMTIDDYSPRYNISPGQPLLSLLGDDDGTRAGWLKWGFIPSWAKSENEGYKHFNARSESVAEKPMFKDAFAHRRCIVMAGSFYEWQHTGSTKQPYRIQLKDQPLMPMAAIWTPYSSADGNKTYSCAILTTDSNDKIRRIHPRMPVILRHEEINTWLSTPSADLEKLQSLMRGYDPLQMTMYPVSSLVNSTKVDSPECIEAL